jgi:CRISPR-associated protein Cas1
LKKSDFILTENYNIRLKEQTAKRLINKIRLNFDRKMLYKNKKSYSYQTILFDNVQNLGRYISEKDTKLEFKIPKLIISNNDSLELREKILKMTSDERKRLGINRSSLWYMKKNIGNGKRIKLYDKTSTKLQEKS